jgi:hypothetical protein
VGRRATNAVWQTKAERVGAAKDIYTLSAAFCKASGFSTDHIDRFWSFVEGRLVDALAEMIGEPRIRIDGLNARSWAEVTIPFVAQVFVRGVDFDWRVENRAKLLKIPRANRELLNGARLLDMLWIAGGICRAAWTVMHAPPGHDFITNDVARMMLHDPESTGALPGWGIPLRRDAALMLTADRANGARLWPNGDEHWVAGPIRHVILSELGIRTFNEAVARHAHKEIYGCSEGAVRSLHAQMSHQSPPEMMFEPNMLVQVPEECPSAQRTYDRVVQLVSLPPASLPAVAGGFDALPVLEITAATHGEDRRPLRGAKIYAGRFSATQFPMLITTHISGDESKYGGRSPFRVLGLRVQRSTDVARAIGLRVKPSETSMHWWFPHPF